MDLHNPDSVYIKVEPGSQEGGGGEMAMDLPNPESVSIKVEPGSQEEGGGEMAMNLTNPESVYIKVEPGSQEEGRGEMAIDLLNPESVYIKVEPGSQEEGRAEMAMDLLNPESVYIKVEPGSQEEWGGEMQYTDRDICLPDVKTEYLQYAANTPKVNRSNLETVSIKTEPGAREGVRGGITYTEIDIHLPDVKKECLECSERSTRTAGSDTDSEYESSAPGPTTKKKLRTEIVHKKCVTTYSRQDFKPSETDNESRRGSPLLRIIGDIVIEYDNNQMEVDDKNPTINHVQKPRHIFGYRLNKAPKTAAERGREYRARKALLRQQRKQQQESDAKVKIATEDIRSAGPSEDNQVPGPSQIRSIEKRAKSAEAMRRWREKKKADIGSSKKQAKTAAQRMREYRQRKKLSKGSHKYGNVKITSSKKKTIEENFDIDYHTTECVSK